MESVHLQLPADLLARVDRAAGDVARNKWIRRAIEDRLKLVEGMRAVEQFPARVAAVHPPVRSISQAKQGTHPIPKGRP